VNTYRPVTKALHWATVVAMGVQFAVGYSLDVGGHGRGRGRGRGGGSGRGRGRGGDGYDVFGDDTLLTVHVLLGVGILLLVTVRLLVRCRTPLPPWSHLLGPAARRITHVVERALYVGMFAVPLSGLVLVLSGDDDLVGLHVAAHIWFFVALACHLAMVVTHSTRRGDRLVRRML
jgi:cytochrome b561